MWEADVGCLPVVDETHRVIAMVTDRDICMAAYTTGRPLSELLVSLAMSKNLITCSPDDRIRDVERLMREAQIRRIPVVDMAGALVGIITLGDIALHGKSNPFRMPMDSVGVINTLADILVPRADLRPAPSRPS